MKIKLKELINSNNALLELKQLKLEIKKAFEIGKFIKKIEEELEVYEEIRLNKIKEY
jgi:hypothetical protein